MVDLEDAGPREPVRTFAIPRHKGSGNLQGPGGSPPTSGTQRWSLGSGDGGEHGAPESRSPLQIEQLIAPSHLQRIRPQPPKRLSSHGPGSSSRAYSRSSSMTMDLPDPSPGFESSGPATPVLTAGEYLTRFPAESLHSFSFSQKQDDPMHTRETVLKRSMDFMKDKKGWAAGGVGIASAQAKIGGDQEMQGIMDLLSRANVLGQERRLATGLGLSLGPVTGPAMSSSENLFEKDFGRSALSAGLCDQTDGTSETQTVPAQVRSTFSDGSRRVPAKINLEGSKDASAELEESISHGTTASNPPRALLNRTFTDVATMSLKNKLTETLEQPYMADGPYMYPMTSPSFPTISASGFPSSVPHAHGRTMPTTQAIFTTQAEYPWTIAAANDLACLMFGVTKSELRHIGILDIVREDKRRWLEQKLKSARAAAVAAASPRAKASPLPSLINSPVGTPRSASPVPSPKSSVLGSGVTARLLSKPSSRESGRWRKTKTESIVDASSTMLESNTIASPTPLSPIAESTFTNDRRTVSEGAKPAAPKVNKAGSVLVCGDVVQIRKRNGAFGSATLWVQEKRGSLIWVMEEIAEDVAYVSVDEVGCVTKAAGASEAVWGMERVRRGMDITRLLPGIPRLVETNTGALDYDRIASLRRFTARTLNDISVPVTVDQISGESTFRVSSFPYMAGMMVISAATLKIASSNAPISEALFGRVANGCQITDLIPDLDKMLDIIAEENDESIAEGMVIMEQSFRRARAALALGQGRAGAADLFFRPTGLTAIHRDGAEFMVDVQLRVVRSDSLVQSHGPIAATSSELVYALWITYSRTDHAISYGVGPITAPESRPGTPPRQPMPRNSVVAMHIDDDDVHTPIDRRISIMTPIPETHPTTFLQPTATPSTTTAPPLPHKKTINDFIILEDMGAGAYGQVKLARPRTTRDSSPSSPARSPPSPSPGAAKNNKVVIKYVTKSRILVDTWIRDRRLGTVPLEIHVLDYLRRDGFRHPNIVEMRDFFEDSVNYYIEMVPHGLPGMDLFDYIELRTNMEESECRRIFAQVASAVEFLHVRAKVVHRDIKDENVVLDGEGNVKLIDFGSASYIKNGPFDVFVGTIDYAAPEVLAGHPYTGPGQDVWALGILLYTILYKENPFYSIDEILDHELRVPYVVSEASIALVRRMLERDVGKRAEVGEVVGHAWLMGS